MAIVPATWDMYDLVQGFLQAPLYHLMLEAFLILWIVKLILSKSYSPPRPVLTDEEKEELISEWNPEPLVPDVPDDHPIIMAMEKNMITGRPSKYLNIGGNKCLNMATFNFLGMAEDKSIEEAALKTLKVYGVGSCGPRGFYGTFDVHLELENQLSHFMKTEESILYSYGFSTIASAIPAYSKRGDIVFCDDGACFSVQKGVVASRSTVIYFKHNDMEDLERVLKIQEEKDKKNPKKAKVTRKFIVVEGLSMNYGDIVPLPKLVELKWKYKVRVFIEESLSFAVLGKTGKGVTEHYGISIDEIDLITANLENSIASCGGFGCGKKYVIDHQRLSGLGYCFSASLPPMLASAAAQALTIIEKDPSVLTKLKENCELMHEGLSKIENVQVVGEKISPIKHLRLTEPTDTRDIDMRTLQMVVDETMNDGVAVTVARYLDNEEHILPQPSIRISVNSKLSREDMDRVVTVLNTNFKKILSKVS